MGEIFRIIRYSKKLWPYYLIIAFLVIIIALLSLATPFLTKLIVDQLVAKIQGDKVEISLIILLVIIIALASALRSFLVNINGYFGDILSTKLNNLLSERYYQQLLDLPLEYFDNEVTGKIISRLDRGVTTISNLMQTLSNNFVQFALSTIVTLVFISFYSWPVALMLAIAVPTYIWLSRLSSKAWTLKQKSINKDIDYSRGRFVESVSQIRVIKSFVTEVMELSIFKKKQSNIVKKTRAQSIQWHKFDLLRQLSLNIVFFLIYGFIFWQTFKSSYSIGTMTMLLQLANQAQFPLFGASFIIEVLQQAQAGSKDYFKVMSLAPSIKDDSKAKRLKVNQGDIAFDDVSFAYKGGQKVLKNISFNIESGEKVALIGESGEGKTTIANLLPRFYQPSSGEILIDGNNINSFSQKSLRNEIGMVFQDPSLFSGTIADNIAYGKSRYNKKQMVLAAKAANAHDFIMKLSKEYNTQIGERGIKLSGGQKQRIAIARMILKNPPILVLDEATSSLDSKAEHEVQRALDHLTKGRTTLIIAHRLSTIANVDKIIAIAKGKIVQAGSPQQLANQKGIYAELLRMQTLTKINKKRLKKFDISKI